MNGLSLPTQISTEALYKYRLEAGKDKDVCHHMTEVFNQNFRMPWDRGDRFFGASNNPVVFGTPLDKAFERLSGVEFDKMVTYNMLLSRYPSSPEFDAVKWKEGRIYHPGDRPVAMLVASVDIDNDGNKDWLIKYSFMFRMPTNEIYGEARNHDFPEQDAIAIFSEGDFDPSRKLALAGC